MSYRALAAALTAALIQTIATPSWAQIELRNDTFESGQTAGFQAGFAAGEEFASTFVPSGSGPFQVLAVRLLFGPAAESHTVTVRVYDDSDLATDPGPALFTGDFTLIGSADALSEIDLSGMNVEVPGPFRVGIELTHAGDPGPARDDDGNITPGRNWINEATLGWSESSVLGLTGDWVLRAEVAGAVDPGDPDAGVGSDAGPGSGEACALNSDCPNGQYCGAGDTCTFDCRLEIDCPGSEICNAIGQCEAGGGGCGCQTGGGIPLGGALLALVAALVCCRRRR